MLVELRILPIQKCMMIIFAYDTSVQKIKAIRAQLSRAGQHQQELRLQIQG